MSKLWKTLKTQVLFSSSVFKLRVEECELPDARVCPKYFIIDFPDWVHAIPVTSSGEMVLLKQYRHATRNVYWEVPGGSTDANRTENPLIAAQRELQEETGYTSNNWNELSVQYPNPALQSNCVRSFLALDCEKTTGPQLDPYEDLEVLLKPVKMVYEMLDKGQFTHSLMMSSLTLARPQLLKLGLLP